MEKINLLAVMLVTSTISGGSNLVFRYPTNPRTAERLSRPVYGKKSVQDSGFSIASKAAKQMGGLTVCETGMSQEADWLYRKSRGEAYDSDDSLDEQFEAALWQPLHVTGGVAEPTRPRRAAPRRPGQQPGPGDQATPNIPNNNHSSTLGGGVGINGAQKYPSTAQTDSSGGQSSSTFDIKDWDTVLGYNRDFLNSLMTPSRALCNKRFELVIDDLAFIGHPVCADENGKWNITTEEPEHEPERGRGRQVERPGSRTASNLQHSGSKELSSLSEGTTSDHASEGDHSFATTYKSEDDHYHQPKSTDKETFPSALTFFHLVLVADKPDPELDYDLAGIVYEILYREVAFKWTAAAFAEQVRSDWVGQECLKLSKIRDRATAQLIPLKQAQAEAFEISPLAKTLREIYKGIKTMTPIQVIVGDIPIDIALPVPPPRIAEEWTKWDDESYYSDSSSESSSDMSLASGDTLGTETDSEADKVVQPSFGQDPAFDFKPWKTLLPLEFIHNLREAPADLEEEDLMRFQQMSQRPAEVSESVRKFLQSLDPTVP